MKSYLSSCYYLARHELITILRFPLSFFAKIMIVAITTIAAICLLSIINKTYRQVEQGLQSEELLAVSIQEVISAKDSAAYLDPAVKNIADIWQHLVEDKISFCNLQQRVNIGLGSRAKVDSVALIDSDLFSKENARALVYSDRLFRMGNSEIFGWSGAQIFQCKVKQIDQLITKINSGREVLLLPFNDIKYLLINKAIFITHYAKVKNMQQLNKLVKTVENINRVFSTNLRIFHGLSILQKIDKFREKVLYWKLLIIIGIAVISGVIFSTISWLEFQQNQYMFAVLRLLGAPPLVLVVHELWVNVCIIIIGMITAFMIMHYNPWLTILFQWNHDTTVVLIGQLCGGLLSMITIIINSRKSIGKVLG